MTQERPILKPVLSRDGLIAEARDWIGTPYCHQASCKRVGCDCLGLIRGLWRVLYGYEPVDPPPYRYDWAENGGRETLLEAAQCHLEPCNPEEVIAGDILFFRWRPEFPVKHCALVSSEGRMIHAYSGSHVAEVRIVPFWQRKIAFAGSFPGLER